MPRFMPFKSLWCRFCARVRLLRAIASCFTGYGLRAPPGVVDTWARPAFGGIGLIPSSTASIACGLVGYLL
jgi:hypothetical protein